MDEWGVVVNEAMSAGLPVMGSIYSQAAVELVSDGANGWLFDPRSEQNVYATLDRALSTPTEELQCRSTAVRIHLNFGWSRTAPNKTPRALPRYIVDFPAMNGEITT